jgi:FAD/FMN-containing dehydrogenase
MTRCESWGRLPRKNVPEARDLHWQSDFLRWVGKKGKPLLAYGLGRSYGDSCLNDDGVLLLTRGLDRFVRFDPVTGLIRCEAGVSLAEVLRLVLPRGWFLPVTPGTKFVTVGGAVANDVHGKNHHVDGTFGHAVRCLELMRSDGSRRECSADQNQDVFYATIGGLGLTGLITWVEFQLKKISSALIDQEVVKFGGLEDFFALSRESERDFAYTVSWIDCLASKNNLGRGLFIRGNHATQSLDDAALKVAASRSATYRVPLDLPTIAMHPLTVKAFNLAYYHKQLRIKHASRVFYDPFFYPLDAVHDWNRIYGKRGFYQYQCVVPFSSGTDAIREILGEISRAKLGSFLAVLKTFGDKPSLGMMSFPRPGVTLALDFANSGQDVLKLFDRLDAITRAAGGSVYIAKDARMSAASFRQYYPRWQEFTHFVDPRFSSSFWGRVTESA